MPKKEFINAENLKNNFFAQTNTRRKKGDKADGDAGYWDGGQCNWGANHNLQDDAQTLANFFNSIANITDDITKIKLSANEQIFKTNQQALITKIKGLLDKCQFTSSTSLAHVCIIWDDYFGYLKRIVDRFTNQLNRQLKLVENLQPNHQKQLLELESQARVAESAYRENLQRANDPNLSESEKAEFIVLANKSSKEAEIIKLKILRNPLMGVNNFNYLDDLRILTKGNIPKNGGSNTPLNTNLPNNNEKSFFEKYGKELLLISIFSAAFYYIYNQDEEK